MIQPMQKVVEVDIVENLAVMLDLEDPVGAVEIGKPIAMSLVLVPVEVQEYKTATQEPMALPLTVAVVEVWIMPRQQLQGGLEIRF
tara:strand:- start:449 stop:706 length:258 start_codon:yes stop_codon:yes gene_type:complete